MKTKAVAQIWHSPLTPLTPAPLYSWALGRMRFISHMHKMYSVRRSLCLKAPLCKGHKHTHIRIYTYSIGYYRVRILVAINAKLNNCSMQITDAKSLRASLGEQCLPFFLCKFPTRNWQLSQVLVWLPHPLHIYGTSMGGSVARAAQHFDWHLHKQFNAIASAFPHLPTFSHTFYPFRYSG